MRSVVFPPRPAKIVRLAALACVFVASAAAPPASEATPQFARQHQLRCTACHLVPPRLNEDGLDFQASGYRLSDQLRRQRRVEADAPGFATFPFAAWITGRFDDQGSGGASDLLLPKVELISGGTLGEQWSYFAEWRIVSLSLNSDGSLKDRGGRFEDLFVQRNFGTRHALRVGQYRALNQVDVSLRLSPSEPLLFKNGLRTGRDPDARINSLLQFSPSSRSPSIGYAFQSVAGDRASDGLFHYVTLPFVGEFSIPLSSEASKTASFELQVYRTRFPGHTFVLCRLAQLILLARLDRRLIPKLLETPGLVVPLHEVGHGGADGLEVLKDSAVDRLLLERTIPPLRHTVRFRFLDKAEAGVDPPIPDLLEEVV